MKNNTTSIESYKLKNGETRYKFQIYLGKDSLTGKDRRTTRSGFKTKKAAQLELSRIRLALNDGTFKNKQNKTYNDVYKLWIVQYQKTVEDSTYNKTLGYFRNHIY